MRPFPALRALSIAVLLALASLPMNGCRPTPASATEIPDLRAIALGDSVKVAVGGRFTGSADSLLLIVTDSTSPLRWKPDTVRFMAPVPASWSTVRIERPVPPYPEGSRQVLRATLQAFYKGVGGGIAVRFASLVVPTNPPGSGTIDSVTVTPINWTGPWNDTASFTVTTWLSSGTRVSVDKKVWTGLKPGRHYVVAFERSEPTRVHVDTAWLDVQARYPNQPAGYLAFARYETMAQLPGTSPGPVPGEQAPLGHWSRVASNNLSVRPDSTAGLVVR